MAEKKFYGINCQGALYIERVSALPVWSAGYLGRLVELTGSGLIYWGALTGWKMIAWDTDLVNHAALTSAHSATSGLTNSTIMMRSAAGQTHVGAPTENTHVARKWDVDVHAALTTHIPAGAQIMWPLNTAPSGFFECNGASLSRTTYATLFGAIGTAYGAVDGTHFSLPDWRGYFPRGWSHGTTRDPDKATRWNRGDGTTGDNNGTVQTGDFVKHGHPMRISTEQDGADADAAGGFMINQHSAASYAAYTGTVSDTAGQQIGGTGGNETRPLNRNTMFIIKY